MSLNNLSKAMSNVFIYTVSDFHDLRAELVKRAFVKISKAKTLKQLFTILHIIKTSKKEPKKKTEDRISLIERKILSFFKLTGVSKVYSFGNTYADLICCLICNRLDIPFVLLSEDNLYKKITTTSERLELDRSLLSDLFKKSSTVICFSEKLTTKNYNEVSGEAIEFVKRVCDHIVIISHKEELPEKMMKYTPQLGDRLTGEVFLIKIP